MPHNRFTLNKRSNPCPICESDDGRCKESAEGIQLCMGVLKKEDIPGFEFRGLTKNSVWGLWVVAQNFSSPAEKQAWQTELERKRLRRYMAAQAERETTLTAARRHEAYTALLGQLSLKDCDRHELQSRGFSDADIARIGFKSVEQWQILETPVDGKLPGVSPDGIRLNVPYAGYICPAFDAVGRICGAQVRHSGDGPRYYWLTSRGKKNVHGQTPHMPSGELPLSVYWPDEITGKQIAFVEGIGPKPALTAMRLGCPVVGAAGGQWGSSPSELKNALGVILEQLEGGVEYVLYPDSGMMDPRHEAVRDRYRDLASCLTSELRVAWWGQKAYGHDIDEIPQGTAISRISMTEFEAMAEGDGELPQELLLELKVSDYAGEDDPFKKVLKANEIGSDFKVRGRSLDRLANFASLSTTSSSASVDAVAAGIYGEIEERSRGEALCGIPSGFYDLDAVTQGWQKSDLIVIAGRPAQGKTAFVLNCARHATRSGVQVAVFSLEMSKEQLTYRLISSEARIESGRLRTGRVGEHEWPVLKQSIATIAELPLRLDDCPGATIAMIRDRLMRSEQKPGLVIVDYLQLIEGPEDSANARVSNISRKLKVLAKELNVPVIALSQLSRSVESRTNKRPIMSDLRDSGAVEQDADLIMMLYREEYYDPDTPDRGLAEIIIAKHRNGPTGTVKLLFEPQYTLFRNLAGPNEKVVYLAPRAKESADDVNWSE